MGAAVNKLHFTAVGLLALLLLLSTVSAAPPNFSPAKIFTGFISNAVQALTKWLWSLKPTTKKAVSGKSSMIKYESGYTVETVFDGSKLGIEPYAVHLLPNGEDLLILDSANSNIFRISSSLSLYSRPKLVTGSAEGYSGHVDGKLREARMNHPKGITVDDRGNIYVADIMNMAIRKISNSGVTTIAGGKLSRGGGHVDGPSEEAKFSEDFDVVYVGSSCSLLVIDRGNQAIREIQLRFDDCAYQYESGFPLGIAMLVGAGFFGYMLALLQRRLSTIVASQDAEGTAMSGISPSPYQKPLKSVRPPLIPSEDELYKQEESFFGSIGKLLTDAGAAAVEIMGGLFPGFRKRPESYEYQSQPLFQQPEKQVHAWHVQESFVVPDDEPPSIDPRTPTPRKTYPFMSKDAEKVQQLWQSQALYSGSNGDLQQQQQQQKHIYNVWDGNLQQQQQKQQQPQKYIYNGWDGDLQKQQQEQKKHHHRNQYHSSVSHTYYEQSREETNEIIIGAVQEQDREDSVVIKPLDYGESLYDHHHNMRSRISSMGYIHRY